MKLADIKGLLFDKDGTLIDLTQTWLAPMRKAASLVASAAKQADLADKLLLSGGYLPEQNSWAQDSIIAFDTSEAMLADWASHTSPALIEHLTPAIRQIVLDSMAHPVPIIHDTAALLARLSHAFTIGIASMDDEANVKRTISGLGLSNIASFHCGADSGFGLKPEAGMVHAFCAQSALKPEQIAVIGDSTHDLKMARAAGALSIGVLCGAGSAQTLRPYADIIIDDISALSEVFASTIEA